MSASPWQPAPEPFDREAAAGVRAKARMQGYDYVAIARTVPLVKQRMSGADDRPKSGWVWRVDNNEVTYFPSSGFGRRKFLAEFFPFFTALKLSIRYAKTEADCR